MDLQYGPVKIYFLADDVMAESSWASRPNIRKNLGRAIGVQHIFDINRLPPTPPIVNPTEQ